MYGLVDSWQRTALETYRIIAGEDSPAVLKTLQQLKLSDSSPKLFWSETVRDETGLDRLEALLTRALHESPDPRPQMADYFAELTAVKDLRS